jgi:hypothetical protein
VAQRHKEYITKPNIEEKFKLSKYSSMNTTKIDSGLKRP